MALATRSVRDPKWEEVLKPRLLAVAKTLSPLRNKLPTRLFTRGLITEDEYERFSKSAKTETDVALDILAVLAKQSSGSFDKFCDVLLETEDKTLDDLEKSLRPHRLVGTSSKHLRETATLYIARHTEQHVAIYIRSSYARNFYRSVYTSVCFVRVFCMLQN